MGYAGLAFALGVAGFHLLPLLPPLWFGLLLLLLFIVLGWLSRRLRWLILAGLGGFWAQIHAGILLDAPFPEPLTRAPLVIEGRIGSIPADGESGQRFLFEVEQTRLNGADAPFAGRVRLSCFKDCPRLRAGERWRLAVRLKPRHGYMNPGGFDYERWLFEQGVKATGYLRGGGSAERLDPGPGAYWLMRWRQEFAEHLARTLSDHRSLGLVIALAIGETSGFGPDDWEVLTLTGTSHLVAISGLNVGMIAGVFLFLVRWLWSRSVRLTLILAAPRAGVLAGALAALGYAGLAGFSVSTQRALIMLTVVFAALYWQRTPRPYHSLTLALVGVLLVDPRAVLSFGFWLSFGGVAILLFNLGQRLPSRDLWTRWGRAQWAVTIGLLPLVLLLFGRVSLIAPLVNLVAEPLFTLVLLPLALLASLLSLIPGLAWPLALTADLLGWCMDGLAWLAALPSAAESIAAPPLWVWGAAGAGALLLLAPRGLPGRWLGLILLLPLLLVRPPGPTRGEAWITVLDVGQGLAVVVRTQEGTLVYDTGPGYPSGFNTGRAVLAPFLLTEGVARVDRLVISHADRDHSGGASGLSERIGIARILSGEPDQLALAGAEPCRAGEGWEWSGVTFRFLHPVEPVESGNNSSCVLRVETGDHAILFTGDLDRRFERSLVAGIGTGLRSDILIAGHHGSATSTGSEFLEAVRPTWVLFSAGYANQYGFPAAEVRARVARFGSRMLNTANAGAIQMRLGPDGAIQDPVRWRQARGRFWTHRPGE